MRKTIFLPGVVSWMMFTGFSQELPRSASFGALVSDLDNSTTHSLQLPSSKGTWLKIF